jgi:putative transposase
VLVFIEHGTRPIHIDGVSAHPTGEWTVQQVRNLAMDLGDWFGDFRFLIRDRGSNFTRSLRAVLADYQEHYNTARPHQGIGPRVPNDDPGLRVIAADPGTCQIRRKPILSGLINEYGLPGLKTGKA